VRLGVVQDDLPFPGTDVVVDGTTDGSGVAARQGEVRL
jgi:hypothetical protein